MIIGHGIDLVEIKRVDLIYNKFKGNFINKYFKNDSIENIKPQILANNFAIKEAFSKSLGLGFRYPCYPNSIAVSRNNLGKPEIKPEFNLRKYMIEKYGDFAIHVSLTDSKKQSIASVIIEKS
tara:strand:- start:5896 stop:6264 length:369 start_codon:yes stop_codon:yes gene_type:complete